jgi:aerobic C4-dicarboxylate transport protein
VGIKALLYFEVVSTFSLALGLIVAHVLRPGDGMNVSLASLDPQALSAYTEPAQTHGTVEFLLNIIPSTVIGAFAQGDILQILLFSILFGWSLSKLGERGAAVLSVIESMTATFFGMVGLVVRLAPIGAFGAMAFTVGKYGIDSLASLGKLLACFYLTCGLFVFVVLGAIAAISGFNILKILSQIKEEIFIVLGTSSSESAFPSLIKKLETLGCGRSTVGLVVPAGYSFNLDGTSIYLTMAALFVAQATHTPLTLGQELTLLAVALVSSKGAAGVTGSGLVTLAATLAAVPSIPVAALALIVGVDRFMSEARAITNLIGNSVATLVIAKWEGDLDREKAGSVSV